MSPADYRRQAEAFEADYRTWCEREAALAGQVAYAIKTRDADAEAVAEQRRKEAEQAANFFWDCAAEARKSARVAEERRRFFSAAVSLSDALTYAEELRGEGEKKERVAA